MTAEHPYLVCACGKVGWLSRGVAGDVLVRAKIAYALYGNRRRREQRVYECPDRAGTWHLTSQPEHRRGGGIVAPTYRVDDDEAAREYLSGALFHGDRAAWDGLLSPERARQTRRVLGMMHQASLREGAERKRRDNPTQYRAWLDEVTPLREALQVRIGEAGLAAHRAATAENIRRSSNQNQRENTYLTALVRRLTLELFEHRAAGGGPEADARLWALLDTAHMPRGTEPIGEIVASGKWYWAQVEHPLDGKVDGPATTTGDA